MFRTRVTTWRTEPRIAGAPIGDADSFRSHPLAREIARLSALVATYPAFRNGPQITRVAGSGPAFVGSRIDRADRRE